MVETGRGCVDELDQIGCYNVAVYEATNQEQSYDSIDMSQAEFNGVNIDGIFAASTGRSKWTSR